MIVFEFVEEISLYFTEILMSSQRSKYYATDPSPEPDESTSNSHKFNKFSFGRQRLSGEL